MRFGLFIPQGWRLDLVGIDPQLHWGVMAGLARRADASHQWESVWVYDHFHTTPRPTMEATHEAWTLMAALAAVTGRVRLGQMCSCIGYRNAAHLAKVAATTDIISEGRVEMGIGAGWYEHEWRAYGYGFPPIGERIAALAEGVEVFRQAWTTGTATVAGKHVQVEGAIVAPRPLQGTSLPGSAANGIPLWIAGGGEKKTLRIAAKYADYTNFDGTPEAFTHKSEVLAAHCTEIGRDVSTIVRSANYNVVIGVTERDVQERLRWYEQHLTSAGLPAEQSARIVENLRAQPLVGTPERVVDTLTDLKTRGLGYAICYFAEAAYDVGAIELFENEVMPALADEAPQEHHRHRLFGRE